MEYVIHRQVGVLWSVRPITFTPHSGEINVNLETPGFSYILDESLEKPLAILQLPSEISFIQIIRFSHKTDQKSLRLIQSNPTLSYPVQDTTVPINIQFFVIRINPYEISDKLGKLYSEMIFKHGFVHSDPHPGNILVRKSKNGTADIILLDHGLYAVSERKRLIWYSFFLPSWLVTENLISTDPERRFSLRLCSAMD